LEEDWGVFLRAHLHGTGKNSIAAGDPQAWFLGGRLNLEF